MLNIKNKSQLSRTMFHAKYGILDLYYEDLEKIFIIDHKKLLFDKIMAGLYLEFAINLMVLCLVMRRFTFMMIYLIELNQLARIKYHVEVYIK